MRFRKRPVEVEAVQWYQNGDHPEDDCMTIISTGDLDVPPGIPYQSEGRIVRYFRKDCPGCGHEARIATLERHVAGAQNPRQGGIMLDARKYVEDMVAEAIGVAVAIGFTGPSLDPELAKAHLTQVFQTLREQRVTALDAGNVPLSRVIIPDGCLPADSTAGPPRGEFKLGEVGG